jgi:hypothetical protein
MRIIVTLRIVMRGKEAEKALVMRTEAIMREGGVKGLGKTRNQSFEQLLIFRFIEIEYKLWNK